MAEPFTKRYVFMYLLINLFYSYLIFLFFYIYIFLFFRKRGERVFLGSHLSRLGIPRLPEGVTSLITVHTDTPFK